MAHQENDIAASRGLSEDFALYACPGCKGRLAVGDHTLQCRACNKTYQVCGGIPNFILEDLSRSANAVFRKVKFFDRLAPIYETRLWYPLVLNLFGGLARTSLPQLIAAVQEMVRSVTGLLLDVACGPGTYGRRVATPSRKVYGIDVSAGMLKQGAAYAQRGHITNIRFARAKVEALPFGNAVFDAALCCGSLRLFADTVLALREVGRTLKPGGPLAAVTVTAGNAGLLRFASVREHYRSRGLRIFETLELEHYLSEAGFENFRPTTYGSVLTFSTQKCRAERVPI